MMIKKQTLNYFILFILIAQAGFPFFVGNTWLLIFTAITGVVFLFKKKKFNQFIGRYIFAFIGLMVLQIIFLGNFLPGPFFGILLRIVFAYMAIKIIGPDFMKYYVNILYVFTVLSLGFWFLFAYVPGFYDMGTMIYKSIVWPITLFPVEVRQNIIIYTNDYWLLDQFPRNAGPFWEPGGFGVFLMVAVLFNLLNTGKLLNKKNYIFFFAIITTFSLGTYATLLIFLYAYFFLIKRIKFSTLLLSGLILFGAYYAYNSFDFLGKKMETRYEKAQNFNSNMTYEDLNYQVGRNEQAILDMNGFIHSPVFGQGQFVKYEYGASASGFTAFLRKWGILGFLLVFGSMLKSFKIFTQIKSIDKRYAYVAVITLIAVTLSQSLYGKPLFLGLSFLFLIFTSQEVNSFKPNDVKNFKIYY